MNVFCEQECGFQCLVRVILSKYVVKNSRQVETRTQDDREHRPSKNDQQIRKELSKTVSPGRQYEYGG